MMAHIARKYKFQPEQVYQHCQEYLHWQRASWPRPTSKQAYYWVCTKLFAKGLKRVGDVMVTDLPPANELPSLSNFRRIYKQQCLLHKCTSPNLARPRAGDEREEK
jgi:hypothetical protein